MEVLVVVFVLAARTATGPYIEEAVTLALGGIHAKRRVLTQCIVIGTCHANGAVVAHGDLAFRALGVAGAAGDDVDHAGRGVLAEHRALRPFQHFDAFYLAKVAEADTVARAIDTVDHHANRRFQSGVVTDRADAADAGGGGGFALGAGHGEAWHQHLQVLDVAHAGVFEQLLGQRGHRDRHVLHGFFALLRGHRHCGQGGRLFGFPRGCGLLRVGLRHSAKRGKYGKCKHLVLRI